MRGWKDWLFALCHLGLFIVWLDYRNHCWVVSKRPAKRFRSWAVEQILEAQKCRYYYDDEEN